MMMCYGFFVFSLKTLPYQEMTLNKSWNWASNNRVNKRSALQFTGPNNETITLSGSVFSELTHGRVSIEVLERMAYLSVPLPLIQGDGVPLGFFVLNGVERKYTELDRHGAPRKINFTIKLTKVDISDFFDEGIIKDIIDIIDIII
ncbi:phage tail protein [Gilliamella apicola]|uniref:Phage tail protein n=1 Tax=Gilliamella apicola TaxID=1196095 RepID=A0A2V4E319_9GAMM|nr:phage tail protein [Gilliamella apicola]KES17085.1 Phage protein U [Gilliamella apicola SCGC AB-598-I20]PXZ04013.1 phage tail protein [Gilliamella apicola]PXZ07632.1 phage tail protein [Gilliamella apicola]